MADETRLVVKYKDVEYPIIGGEAGDVTEVLTEREKFDAERMTGQGWNQMGGYTSAQVLAFFTLRRAGITMTFDDFLDSSGFEFDRQEVPLAEASVTESEPPSGGDLTETDGTPTSAPSSEYTPG